MPPPNSSPARATRSAGRFRWRHVAHYAGSWLNAKAITPTATSTAPATISQRAISEIIYFHLAQVLWMGSFDCILSGDAALTSDDPKYRLAAESGSQAEAGWRVSRDTSGSELGSSPGLVQSLPVTHLNRGAVTLLTEQSAMTAQSKAPPLQRGCNGLMTKM